MTYIEIDVANLGRPYFVYGTLRPQCGNSGWWRELGATAVHDGKVKVYGYGLISSGIIPYAVVDDEASVVGALIIPPGNYQQAVELRLVLDRLEGHPRHYERIVVEAHTPYNGEVLAWLYTPTTYHPTGTLIPSGDYYVFRGKEAR